MLKKRLLFSLSLLAFVSAWSLYDDVFALKPPHDASRSISCVNCHPTNTFKTITSFNNFCMNDLGCHNLTKAMPQSAKKKRFSTRNASDRFGNISVNTRGNASPQIQFAHGWRIPNTNPDAGVVSSWGEGYMPSSYPFLREKIYCSRCHITHLESPNRYGLRETLTGNKICMNCHAARQVSNVRDPLPEGKHYSHPVEVNYSSVRAAKPDYFEASPLNPYPQNPTAAFKLFTTYGTNGTDGAKGGVVCQTCHGPLHASDSNPYTFDSLSSYSLGAYSTSSGNLLRRYNYTNSNEFCTSCHALQSHRTFNCSRCHTPHKKSDEYNRYLVYETISTPNSGRLPVQFISTTAMANRYDLNGVPKGICQVCHTQTANHRNYSTPSANSAHNYDGERFAFCPTCHKHQQGFSANCTNCHTYPPGGDQGTYRGSRTHNLHLDTYEFPCSRCHYVWPVNHNQSGVTSSADWSSKFNPNNVDVAFDPSINPSGTSTVVTSGGSRNRRCQNLYCHMQSGTVGSTDVTQLGGTNQTGNTPTWDHAFNPDSFGRYSTTKETGSCGTCHDVVRDNSDKAASPDNLGNWPIWNGSGKLNNWTSNSTPLVWDVTPGTSFGDHQQKAYWSHLDFPRGPRVTCKICHPMPPTVIGGSTAPGTKKHNNAQLDFADGETTLAATAVCANCHSPGGAYNGVNSTPKGDFTSVGAKDNFSTGVYTNYTSDTLLPGKERWCVGCHDNEPPTITSPGTGGVPRTPVPVAGDDETYGFFISGHGRPSSQRYDKDQLGDGSGNSGAGKQCTTCHDPRRSHINGPDSDIPGQRLRTNINGISISSTGYVYTVCKACHQNTGGSDSASKQVSAHGNAETEGYIKIEGETFFVQCQGCHEPHGKNLNVSGTRNLKMIRKEIKIFSGETPFTISTSVVFTNTTGVNSFDEIDSNDADDICASCHSNSSNLGYPMTRHVGGNHTGVDAMQSDQRGQKCTTCHQHDYKSDGIVVNDNGWMPAGCDACHTYPPGGQQGTYRGSRTHSVHVDTYGFACSACHFNFPTGHNQSGVGGKDDWKDGLGSDFNPNNVNIDFDPALNPSGSSTIITSGSTRNRGCNSLYCHAQSGTINGKSLTTLGGTNQTTNTPTWDYAFNPDAFGRYSTSKLTGACGTCHDATKNNSSQGGSFWPRFSNQSSFNNWSGSGTPRIWDVSSGTSLGDATGQTTHKTHLDRLKGPKVTCKNCHATPPTITGNDVGTLGIRHVNQTLDFKDGTTAKATTTACNTCHSAGGNYNGVTSSGSSIGAKDNWTLGVYQNNTTLAGTAEKWCAGCHDTDAPVQNGATAPNVSGDNVEYGYYISGHGLEAGSKYDQHNVDDAVGNSGAGKGCSKCHDATKEHINGANDATFNGQRLRGSINNASSPDIAGVCKACHQVTGGSDSATKQVSNHGNSTSGGYTAPIEANFTVECPVCHEVHGNNRNVNVGPENIRNLKMVRNSVLSNDVVFTSAIDADSFDESDSNDTDDFCATCHSNAANTGYPMIRHVGGNHTGSGGLGTDQRGSNCTSCHSHNYSPGDGNVTANDGFMPGESAGNADCAGCHSDFFNPMATKNDRYHHYMNNGGVSTLSSGSKYPVINPPAPLAGTTDANRRCLMCHVEHDMFKPQLNPYSQGRSFNLRTDIGILPNMTTAGANTDFIGSTHPKAALAPNGGICLSCHQNSQFKSYTQPDGTTRTPVINKALFENSPHNYTADSTFNNGSTIFKANCSKCHIDTLPKNKQSTQGNQFGPHFSEIRRLQAVMINDFNNGTVSSATANTLVDTTKTWVTNAWKYRTVKIIEGTGAGQMPRNITANTATSLTVSPDWTVTPDATSKYMMIDSRTFDNGMVNSATTTSLTDTTKAWTTNYWSNRPVNIVKGKGYTQTRKVMSNTATTLYIDGTTPYTTVPDGTSRYSLGDPMEEDLCFRCHSTNTNQNSASNRDYYNVKTFVNTKALQMENAFFAYGEMTKISVAGTTALTGTGVSWQDNQWAGQRVTILNSYGAGQVATISSNNSNTVYLSSAIGAPDRRSNMWVGAGDPFRHRVEKYFGGHRGDESINAPTNATATGWLYDSTVSNGLHSGCVDCHNPHGNRKPGEDSGTATSGTALTITDTTKAWTTDKWRGYIVRIMAGAGAGQERVVLKNTATVLTIAENTTAETSTLGGFSSLPNNTSYYVIYPNGHPTKGNNLWFPNNGAWGVTVSNYTTPTPGTMNSPRFTKNMILEAKTDATGSRIYDLCFKCHSDYGFGTGQTPFNIPDSLGTLADDYVEGPSTNIAQEFNPKNLGYHPVVAPGANQPIIPMGSSPIDIAGPFTISAGSAVYVSSTTTTVQTISFTGSLTPEQWQGNCIDVTSGTELGTVRSIAGYIPGSPARLKLDPQLINSLSSGNTFYIRKCSSYHIGHPGGGWQSPRIDGATYKLATAWPRFTLGTLNLTAGSNTATITGLTNGIPSTTLRGWYLYAGTLLSTTNPRNLPFIGKCSATAPCPPWVSTSGWFQITDISAGASAIGATTATVTITPTPTSSYSSTYALTSGLGNAFVPPYGPWSTMGCADCHDADHTTDPSGPHGSARMWILRNFESNKFQWYRGGEQSTTPTTDSRNVITISWPVSNSSLWQLGLGSGDDVMKNYVCLNCHRYDTYGWDSKSPYYDRNTGITGYQTPGTILPYGWKMLGRQPHTPFYSTNMATRGYYSIYGIGCMSCHGGDNRDDRKLNRTNWYTNNPAPYYRALGGIHGSNLSKGSSLTGALVKSDGINSVSSYRGRRLLNGAAWLGVLRGYTYRQVFCWYSMKPDLGSVTTPNDTTAPADAVNKCGFGLSGGLYNDGYEQMNLSTSNGVASALYPYFSGED